MFALNSAWIVLGMNSMSCCHLQSNPCAPLQTGDVCSCSSPSFPIECTMHCAENSSFKAVNSCSFIKIFRNLKYGCSSVRLQLSHFSCGCGSLMAKVTYSWSACHEFEPSTVEDPQCRGTMHVTFVEAQISSRRCGVEVRKGVPAEVSSSLLDHGLKLRDPSLKTLEYLNSGR
ncbi:hypothetical protein TNCV_3030601 [Trichonephila clavipes]|nr:hypothetical protein TNCV_3030601 [Trichonephila clavipes]